MYNNKTETRFDTNNQIKFMSEEEIMKYLIEINNINDK